MDNLTPRIQRLVTRLSGQEVPGRPLPPLDPAVTEAGYRQALRRWFGLTAQGPSADGDQVDDADPPSATSALPSSVPPSHSFTRHLKEEGGGEGPEQTSGSS